MAKIAIIDEKNARTVGTYNRRCSGIDGGLLSSIALRILYRERSFNASIAENSGKLP